MKPIEIGKKNRDITPLSHREATHLLTIRREKAEWDVFNSTTFIHSVTYSLNHSFSDLYIHVINMFLALQV